MTPSTTLLTIALISHAAAAQAQTPAGLPEQAFERLKTLTGTWKTASTKGWTGVSSYRVIAKGSVLLYASEFDDAPGAGMITTFFLDGKSLKLTHYCESRTQPTLAATDISPDGRSIEFTFHSGTSLPSRNTGHMDRLLMHFIDANHYTARWTWYQTGKESWMEEITYERAPTLSSDGK